jgi:hypothetical protein
VREFGEMTERYNQDEPSPRIIFVARGDDLVAISYNVGLFVDLVGHHDVLVAMKVKTSTFQKFKI